MEPGAGRRGKAEGEGQGRGGVILPIFKNDFIAVQYSFMQKGRGRALPIFNKHVVTPSVEYCLLLV